MKTIVKDQALEAYAAPKLIVYGKFAEVTAAGNSATRECGNNGLQKGCNRP